MNNRLALSIHPWWIDGNLDRLEQELSAVEEAGADFAELVLHGLDVVIGGRLIPARLRRVQAILRRHALRYTLHLPYELNLLDRETSALYERLFLAGIQFARETGCELIVYHAGFARGEAEALRRREMEILNRLLDAAGELPLCMENGPFYGAGLFSAGSSAKKMARFCRLVGRPNFRLTFDVGHNFLQNRGDADALLSDAETLLPFVGHVHLHDNLGIPLRMEENDYSHRIACGAADLHLPPGWGGIPFGRVLDVLQPYRGIFVLEIEKRFADQYRDSLDFVKQLSGGEEEAPEKLRTC